LPAFVNLPKLIAASGQAIFLNRNLVPWPLCIVHNANLSRFDDPFMPTIIKTNMTSSRQDKYINMTTQVFSQGVAVKYPRRFASSVLRLSSAMLTEVGLPEFETKIAGEWNHPSKGWPTAFRSYDILRT
jgi:hypothetical protein